METNEELKIDKPYNGMYISLIVFGIVFVLTIGLYFYNSKLSKDLETLNNEISVLENNLKVLNEDNEIILYNLITSNKIFLDKYKYLSDVPKIINNLKKLSRDYSITFDWFNYSSASLSANAFVINDDKSLASSKAEKFIKYFRDTETKDMFSLWFVWSFAWQEKIDFSTQFKINP